MTTPTYTLDDVAEALEANGAILKPFGFAQLLTFNEVLVFADEAPTIARALTLMVKHHKASKEKP